MKAPEFLKSAGPRGIRGFVAWQLLILSAAAGWSGYRASELEARQALPPLRHQPLLVAPLYDYPVVVSDEQLARILGKLAPRFAGDKTKINHVDHGLRFWGLAKFHDPKLSSGEALRRLLTDHRRFVEVFGADKPPLLMDGPAGVRVRVQEGATASSHVDHTLACLAEAGTPLDYPLWTPTRQTTYRAMLEQSLLDFSLNQIEYEWSALAYALFVPPTTHWMTSEGQVVSFDRLAQRIMRQELPQGVCFANHRLHALVMLLRVDDQMPILAPARRAAVIEYLQDVTRTLVSTQHPDGYWDGDWPKSVPPESKDAAASGDQQTDRILATGHALEWWALAPQEVHPPRSVLAAAGQWLCRTIDDLTPENVQESYTFLSHAGRALALWRGRWPADVELGQ